MRARLGFYFRRSALFLAAVALVIACTRDAAGDRGRYSVLPNGKLPDPTELIESTRVQLVPIGALGRPSDGSADSFGFVSDAAFGADSTLYVVDSRLGHVAVFNPRGTFIRFIGSPGTDDGHLLKPTRISIDGTNVLVFDAGLRAVVFFDTAGTFRRSIPLPNGGLASDLLAVPPERGFVISAVKSSAGLVARYTLAGELQSTYIAYQPRPGTAQPSVAGRICMPDSDRLIFANPFIYETVAINAVTRHIEWAREWQSTAFGTVDFRTPTGTLQQLPRAPLLGIVCSSKLVIVAYLGAAILYYDFFRPDGIPIARLQYSANPQGDYPGFVGDILGDRLVAFRTKPYSQVTTYQIRWHSPHDRPTGHSNEID